MYVYFYIVFVIINFNIITFSYQVMGEILLNTTIRGLNHVNHELYIYFFFQLSNYLYKYTVSG